MPTSDAKPRRTRGRPRQEGAEERIFEAALEEYGARGWSGFTMDAVARRAGVGKSTIYLRWQDKSSLLTDAVRARSGTIATVDTGTFRGDLERLAGNLYRYYLDPAGWATLRMTVDAAGASEPLGGFTDAVADLHRSVGQRIIDRAVERGDAPAEFPASPFIACLYGGVTIRVLTLSGEGRKPTEEDIDAWVARLVTFVLAGAGIAG